MTSCNTFAVSSKLRCCVEYKPAGVKRRLPSGVNVNRRKNDFRLSFAYIWVLRAPIAVYGFGDASIGMTAGSGSDGAGEADLRMDMDGEAAPKDDLRL